MKSTIQVCGLALATAAILSGCNKIWDKLPGHGKPDNNNNDIVLKDYSVTPSLVKMFPGYNSVKINTLISSDDVLPQSHGFVYGAQPDGAGLIKNPDGNGYLLISNHEILRSVSRVYLNKNFKPMKGEYIVDADGGQWRLCSATMATPEVHGFGPVFLTAGESGPDSRVHAINPLGSVLDKKRTDRVLPALGRQSMENAVPFPKDAFPGKTVIAIGEDDGNGQVLLYISDNVGDLQNGKLYFLRRTDLDPVETNIQLGNTYNVEFVEVDNSTTATGAEIAQQSIDKKAVQFARVEDLDYRKGGGNNSRELYFTATGVKDQVGKNMWGRVYKLNLDKNNPLKGKIEAIADGGVNPGYDLINPDNVCATENYVYIQEDGDSFYPGAMHDSYIWIYNIATKKYQPFLTTDQRRDNVAFNSKYNTVGNNTLGTWEFGAMYDISKTIGVDNTFLLNIHPHTWQEEKFKDADGTTVTGNKEGGQTIILRNVPK